MMHAASRARSFIFCIREDLIVKRFVYSMVVMAGIGVSSMFAATDVMAGINVNENGNSVLCKGKSCDWLKPACKKEGGTYTEGSGGTGKCNFPAVADVGFTAKPMGPSPTTKQMPPAAKQMQ